VRCPRDFPAALRLRAPPPQGGSLGHVKFKVNLWAKVDNPLRGFWARRRWRVRGAMGRFSLGVDIGSSKTALSVYDHERQVRCPPCDRRRGPKKALRWMGPRVARPLVHGFRRGPMRLGIASPLPQRVLDTEIRVPLQCATAFEVGDDKTMPSCVFPQRGGSIVGKRAETRSAKQCDKVWTRRCEARLSASCCMDTCVSAAPAARSGA
jgi:hypothetical protein